MRALRLLPLSTLALLAACTGTSVPMDNSAEESSSSVMMIDLSSSEASSMPTMEASSAPATSSTETSAPTVINMKVENWEFAPNVVTMKQGDNVVIRITGGTGEHSFLSQDLGINVRVAPGETKDIVIPTDKAGTFAFRCGVPCGEGHREMKGEIIIQ